MSAQAGPDPLRRKIGGGRGAATPGAMTPRRAWRRALVHGLAEAIKLPVVVKDVDLAARQPEAVGALAGEHDLILLLEGPMGFGVALLDPAALSSIIEAQTMGRVLTRSPVERPPTVTDASMAADPLDRVLSLFDEFSTQVEGEVLATGFRYATRLKDPRTIALSLSDVPHTTVRIEAGYGDHGRPGVVQVILPVAPLAADEPQEGGETWGQRLEGQLMESEVPLVAVLARLRMSIGSVADWAPGQLLALPEDCLSSLEVMSQTGTILAGGRLGRAGPNKAVRLGAAVEAEGAADAGAIALGMGGAPAGLSGFGGGAGGLDGELPALGGMDGAGGMDGGLPDIGGDIGGGGLPDLGDDLPGLGDDDGPGMAMGAFEMQPIED